MIRPLRKRLLVEPVEDEKLSKIIEVVQFDKFNQKSSGVQGKTRTKGVVVRLGSDCDHLHGVKPGDLVHFTKHGGLPVDHEGKEYMILQEADLIGPEVD